MSRMSSTETIIFIVLCIFCITMSLVEIRTDERSKKQ